MTRLNVNDARCEALFASGLQRSDAPTAEALAEVISRTVRQLGIAGCLSRVAQEFGDHPEAAANRMRWIRQLVTGTYAPATSRPGSPGNRPPAPGSGPLVTPGSAPRAARPATGRFARQYADQNERDHAQLVSAIAAGAVDSLPG